jgi:hypothetical protein
MCMYMLLLMIKPFGIEINNQIAHLPVSSISYYNVH